MNRPMLLRRLLLAPPSLRTSLLPRTLRVLPTRQYATVQSVTQPSFWLNLIPKPLRRSSSPSAEPKRPKSKEWNPATFYIWIFLLIGSMSIQMIALHNDFAAFSRRADSKIGLLKEIIGRIQNGEKVDVEGLLGTGDKEKEKEWEEVLKEIEREDQAWEESRRKKPKHGSNLADQNSKTPGQVDANNNAAMSRPKSNAPPGFY